MSHIGQHLRKEIESRDLGGYYQERICIWPVSKDLRGELGVADQERQQCSKSDCLTLKGHVTLKAQVHHHAPCDSIMSRPLDGEMEGEIVFAHIDDGEVRGYHIGKVEWRAGGSTLIGQLSDVTNALDAPATAARLGAARPSRPHGGSAGCGRDGRRAQGMPPRGCLRARRSMRGAVMEGGATGLVEPQPEDHG